MNGIVIVTFDPFRVFTISWDSIATYGETVGMDPDKAYSALCYALAALVLDLSDEDSFEQVDEEPAEATLSGMRAMGMRLDNTDLAITGVIDPHAHDAMMMGTASRRKGYSMLHEIIHLIVADEAPSLPYDVQPVRDDDYDSGGSGGGHSHDH